MVAFWWNVHLYHYSLNSLSFILYQSHFNEFPLTHQYITSWVNEIRNLHPQHLLVLLTNIIRIPDLPSPFPNYMLSFTNAISRTQRSCSTVWQISSFFNEIIEYLAICLIVDRNLSLALTENHWYFWCFWLWKLLSWNACLVVRL